MKYLNKQDVLDKLQEILDMKESYIPWLSIKEQLTEHLQIEALRDFAKLSSHDYSFDDLIMLFEDKRNYWKIDWDKRRESMEKIEQEKAEFESIKNDPSINHPDYYNTTEIEPIDVIYDWGYGEGFAIGNAIKYLSRAGKKDKESKLKDVKKACWYLYDLIERLEKDE